jgi:hypothetical protein
VLGRTDHRRTIGIAATIPRDLPCLIKPVFRDKLAEALERLLDPPESEPGNLPPMVGPRGAGVPQDRDSSLGRSQRT